MQSSSRTNRLEPTGLGPTFRRWNGSQSDAIGKRNKSAEACNLDVIRRALEAAGVEFIDENGGGAGVRLRKPSKKA